MVCHQCGAEMNGTVCGTCSATSAYAAPQAETNVPSVAGRTPNRSLRAASIIQLILSILYVVGGIAFYVTRFRLPGGVATNIAVVLGGLAWFVASIFLRREHERWAWAISVGIAALLLGLMAYRLALGQIVVRQIAILATVLIVDLFLLIRGRQGLAG
jgi:hypothetical protein